MLLARAIITVVSSVGGAALIVTSAEPALAPASVQARDQSSGSMNPIQTRDIDGKTVTGRWDGSRDGSHCERDFELTYAKVV